MARKYVKKVESAGFEVRLVNEAYSDDTGNYPALYHVEGHGVSLSLTEDAEHIWEGLLSHADATKQISPSAAGEPEPPPDSEGT